MRYPKFLEKGGTIGFIAPSFGCNREPYKSCFDHGQQVLADKGYELRLGPNCYEGCGFGISNTPELCGGEVNTFFRDPDVDVILSCGGGELMCEILDHVDFQAIAKAEPKWYMGYSDNTNLTFLLTTLCDTASIYGPNAPSFGMEPWHPAIHDAYGVLTGQKLTLQGYSHWEKESLKTKENPLVPYNVSEPRVMQLSEPGVVSMQGRLLGGCLDCLATLCGTCYDEVAAFNERYGEEGVIWFLEACDLNPMDLRRALWRLKHAGWFEKAKGFLVGRPMHYGEDFMGMTMNDAVMEMLGDLEVPIVMDVDLGHLPPAMPLICGAVATVEATTKKIRVKMELQ